MVYSFALTTSLGRLLYQLKSTHHCYIIYSNNIEFYLKMLIHDQPSHIIGLGIYSGVDQNKIRIETITRNRFRNNKIENIKQEKIRLDNFLIPTNKYFQLTQALGNSWCNLISWKVARLIETGELQSKYSFLHIPKLYRSTNTVRLIDEIIWSAVK